MESALEHTIREFENVEANLARLDKLWGQIREYLRKGTAYAVDAVGDAEYDDNVAAFRRILAVMPKINGDALPDLLMPSAEIRTARLHAVELGEAQDQIAFETSIGAQGRALKLYRSRLNSQRRELARQRIPDLIRAVEEDLRSLTEEAKDKEPNASMKGPGWDQLRQHVKEIETLLGSSIELPLRGHYLGRHLHFACKNDLEDIIKHDWPAFLTGLQSAVYAETDPLPVQTKDIGSLVASRPTGGIVTTLSWERLSPEDFERLVFNLVSRCPGYENPQWLTNTNAPDKGRDLSAMRVFADRLAGTIRQRVIIQCRHKPGKSIAMGDLALLREQMKLWEPPRVDVLVVATTGHFTTDAVDYIERMNQEHQGADIEMWPQSHLEMLLAERPDLIAEFRLRG